MADKNVPLIIVTVLIIVFALVLLWMIAVYFVGTIYPTIWNLNPGGFWSSNYISIMGTLWNGTNWPFYVAIGAILFYAAYKLLYEKEETTYYQS